MGDIAGTAIMFVVASVLALMAFRIDDSSKADIRAGYRRRQRYVRWSLRWFYAVAASALLVNLVYLLVSR